MQRYLRSTSLALCALLVALTLTSCRTSREVAPNTLTSKERKQGWVLLFNGESPEGWRGFNKEGVPSKWVVQDGALHFDPKAAGQGGDIVSANTYGDFELQLDWKIGACGNSGVFFHVSEGQQYDTVWRTGPEVQVLDNSCHPDAKNGPDRYAGANYALQAPNPVDAARPAGEWNHMRVLVKGPHVEHWLNGKKVVAYELWGDAWKQAVQKSKFNDMKDYGMMKTGHIALQDHGDPVWFRNIKIRPLDRAV